MRNEVANGIKSAHGQFRAKGRIGVWGDEDKAIKVFGLFNDRTPI